MKIEIIIVAAGLGKRLKTPIPKALFPLKGKALVTYCLEIFEQCTAINGIIIVIPKGYDKQFKRVIRPLKKVRALVDGGVMRMDSVKSGLRAVASDTSHVLVHDAARPLIDRESIGRLIGALKRDKAAILGVPVKSTLKEVNKKHVIENTPCRELFWEAQTPQGFKKDVLIKAHAVNHQNDVTDDAMMVERLGYKVRMVMGSYLNIKVTTPEDIILAKQLLVGIK